ncbi:uncharacterized protein A4U43_C01F29600 [Asparagus officinalis]|uniref:Uncharacterized protein n=2 Tax=Asparagus officinalis TaxID=4686 RepID=A0A5P1FTR5_ASPOF|nr:uncharacterized protein A4U43_C01F29600 [Asparagus officinalis]
MMMRGLADPLASAYCHLYMAHCADSLNPGDKGYLIASISNIARLLERMIVNKETITTHSYKSNKMVMMLMEPAIEWIMKCIHIDSCNKELGGVLSEFGFCTTLSEPSKRVPCISIILHYLLKQLPAEFISMNALEVIDLYEQNKDISLEQHLNYRLLGLKLFESPPPISSIEAVLRHVSKVANQYDCLDEYLIVADAYMDIILHYSLDDSLSIFLDGILQRAENRRAVENEMDVLQSILVKLINHFDSIEDVFSLNHFTGILELLHGSSWSMVNTKILQKATSTGVISDPRTVQFLFEICQDLHNSIDISDLDSDIQRARLISSFVQMVDFGGEGEPHLTFLIECRAAFWQINELKDTLVHICNNLAVKAIKTMKKITNFLKACIAFNEVTIPSISSSVRRMNLYLETTEVALFGGLISHTEGLINSAISCLQNLNMTAGFQKSFDIDQVVSLSCKLCSILVMVPGNHEEGVTLLLRNLVSVVDCQSLTSPRIKTEILFAIVSLSASLTQTKLPYRASSSQVVSNDKLFYGDASYHKELSSLSSLALQKLVDVIEEEPNLATRGRLALDACNHLIICFKANPQLHLKCAQLIDIAKLYLHVKDKYMESTGSFFHKKFSNL